MEAKYRGTGTESMWRLNTGVPVQSQCAGAPVSPGNSKGLTYFFLQMYIQGVTVQSQCAGAPVSRGN